MLDTDELKQNFIREGDRLEWKMWWRQRGHMQNILLSQKSKHDSMGNLRYIK